LATRILLARVLQLGSVQTSLPRASDTRSVLHIHLQRGAAKLFRALAGTMFNQQNAGHSGLRQTCNNVHLEACGHFLGFRKPAGQGSQPAEAWLTFHSDGDSPKIWAMFRLAEASLS
jgi:hypothetical protein